MGLFGPSVGQMIFEMYIDQDLRALYQCNEDVMTLRYLSNSSNEHQYRVTMIQMVREIIQTIAAGRSIQETQRQLNRHSRKDLDRLRDFYAYGLWCTSPNAARRQGIRDVSWSSLFGRPNVECGPGMFAQAATAAAGFTAGYWAAGKLRG